MGDANVEELGTTAPPKILVADDDRVYRILLERSARSWGYDPVVVGDGEDAWRELTRDNGPRLALLDWVMPGADGLEVCRRVRRASLPHYVYLILLTAHTEPHDLISGLEAGADEFVAKPVKLDQLRLQVRAGMRIVDSGTHRDSAPKTELLDQLRRLSARLLRTQEEERSTAARELHEGVAQDLSSVLMQLGIAAADAGRREEILNRVPATIEAALHRVRSLAYTLYPLLLDDIGLAPALRHYAEAVWKDRGLAIKLVLPDGFGRIDAHVERALFRIAQETLENTRAHSRRARAEIRLERGDAEARLDIVLPASRADLAGDGAEGIGILAMRERAEQAGGRLELRRGARVTTVSAILPISSGMGRGATR